MVPPNFHALSLFALLLASLPALPRIAAAAAQEGPSLFQPLFDYSSSYRQSVCYRQSMLHSGNVTLRDALDGYQLKTFTIAGRYFRRNDDGGIDDAGYPGLLPELLDEIARRAGLTWRDSYGLLDSVVIPENRTYDELLQWTIETYDLSAAWWTETVERMSAGATFPMGWLDSSLILIGKEDSDGSSVEVFAFLRPFHWTVWVMIAVTVVVSGLVYWGLEMYNDGSDAQSLAGEPMTNVFYSAMSFTGQFEFQPHTNYARLFTWSLSFWALLIIAAYTANFASFLVAENDSGVQIKSVQDAVRFNMPLCVMRSTADDKVLSRTFPSARLVRVEDEPDVYHGLNAGMCSFAVSSVGEWEEFEGQRDINADCDLTWVGRVFRFQTAGFALKSDSGTLCTSLIRDVINLHLVEMKEDGTIDRLWQRHVKAMADVNCDAIKAAETLVAIDGDEESQQLDLGDMGGLFIFHFSLMGLAMFMAVVYQCRRKRAERMRMAAERKKEKSAAQDDEPDTGGSALSHEQLDQEVEEGRRSKAVYEAQNERLAEMSEQMKKLLETMEEIQGESSLGVPL